MTLHPTHRSALRSSLMSSLTTSLITSLLMLAAGTALAQTPPDANLARNLAATCANCHGTNGQARGEMKPLAGAPAERTIALMNEFKAGNLPATIMHQIAKGYTDEQLRLIAGYFAAQKPAP